MIKCNVISIIPDVATAVLETTPGTVAAVLTGSPESEREAGSKDAVDGPGPVAAD